MQEAGRGGRNGKKAFAVVLKNKSDIYDAEVRMKKSLPTVDYIKTVYFNLNQFFQISYGQLIDSNFEFNLSEFCSKYKFPIVKTYNALKLLEKEGILYMDDTIGKRPTI